MVEDEAVAGWAGGGKGEILSYRLFLPEKSSLIAFKRRPRQLFPLLVPHFFPLIYATDHTLKCTHYSLSFTLYPSETTLSNLEDLSF